MQWQDKSDSERQNALEIKEYIKKMSLFTCNEKILIVLTVGENYKAPREAQIINNKHPNGNINHSTVTKILNEFKNNWSININFNMKRRKRIANENRQLEVRLCVVKIQNCRCGKGSHCYKIM